MTAESTEKRFVKRVRELLVSLPYDMKVLFEAITDENLPTPARHVAAAAAVYCLSPSDPLPDTLGLLGFIDDVVFVRLSLQRLLELGGEDAAIYTERYPEVLDPLAADLALLREYLGSSMEWLQHRLEKGSKQRYKGKAATTYVEDDEARDFLYDEGHRFTTDYEIDEEAAAKLASGKPVLEAFKRRMAEESRWIG